VKSALDELPKRFRPNVKVESGHAGGSGCETVGDSLLAPSTNADIGSEQQTNEHIVGRMAMSSSMLLTGNVTVPAGSEQPAPSTEPAFIIERTFLKLIEPGAAMSHSEVPYSAPCGPATAHEPPNPRRWSVQ